MINSVMVDGAEALKLMVDGKVAWERTALPAGYQRCSYLQGVGDITTYFVIPQIDITNKPYVRLECMYPPYTGDTNAFGSIVNDTRFEQGIGWSGTSFSYNYGNGYGGLGESKKGNVQTINGIVHANRLTEKRLLIEYKNDTIYLDGVEQTIAKSAQYAQGNFGIATDVYLFGTNREKEKRYFSGRIYRFSVENQIDLVPALDRNGIPCMYDLIFRNTFYNAGTGEFLYELA